MTPYKQTNPSLFATSNRLLRYFLVLYHSNIFIALAAGAMVWQTSLLFNIPFSVAFEPIVLLAASSFVFYGLHDYCTKANIGIYHPSATRQQFWQNHTPKMVLPLLGGLAVMLYCLYRQLDRPSVGLLVVCGTLAIGYSFPVLPKVIGKKFTSNAMVKLLVLAGVWTITTTLIVFPLQFWWHTETLAFLALRFCFLILLCIPFDVRDAAFDKPEMGRTLIEFFGISRLSGICIITYFVSLLCIVGMMYLQLLNAAAAIGLSLHLAYVNWLAIKSIRYPGPEEQYAWLDAQMLVSAIIIGACKWFY